MANRERADQGGPFKEFVITEWLCDGIEGMRSRIKSRREQFEPANFRKHIRNAQKEQLLAMRSMIDGALERLEKAEEPVQE